MIVISRNEANYLVSRGAKWQNQLHRSYSSGHKIYLTEDYKWLKMLNTYRQQHTYPAN